MEAVLPQVDATAGESQGVPAQPMSTNSAPGTSQLGVSSASEDGGGASSAENGGCGSNGSGVSNCHACNGVSFSRVAASSVRENGADFENPNSVSRGFERQNGYGNGLVSRSPAVVGLQPVALVDHVARVDWSLLAAVPGERGGSMRVTVEELHHILVELLALLWNLLRRLRIPMALLWNLPRRLRIPRTTVQMILTVELHHMAWEGSVNPRVESDQRAQDCLLPMGITYENVAERYGIGRKQQDATAVNSHQKAAAARASGRFKDEIIPVHTKLVDPKTGEEKKVVISEDDGIRPETTVADLAKLKTVFKNLAQRLQGYCTTCLGTLHK